MPPPGRAAVKLAIGAPGELFGGVERHVPDLCRYYGREGPDPPLVLVFHDRELAARLRGRGRSPGSSARSISPASRGWPAGGSATPAASRTTWAPSTPSATGARRAARGAA